MSDNNIDRHKNALQRSIDEGGTEADKAFHEDNLKRHLEEGDEDEQRTTDD